MLIGAAMSEGGLPGCTCRRRVALPPDPQALDLTKGEALRCTEQGRRRSKPRGGWGDCYPQRRRARTGGTQIRADVAIAVATSVSQASWKGRNYWVTEGRAARQRTPAAEGTGETRTLGRQGRSSANKHPP